MWHATMARIAEYSDVREFERMCADLLVRFGFADIIPRGPASQDGGADATGAYFPEEQAFQFSIQRTWRRKILDTVSTLVRPEGRRLRRGGSLVFVTNQAVQPLARDRIIAQVRSRNRVNLIVFDREWLRLQLDLNQDIRSTYLGIPPDRGYRRGVNRAARGELAVHLALPDFVRHLFTLAVIRRAPYLAFLRAYYQKRIAPFIRDPSSTMSKLLPLDRSKAAAPRRRTVRNGNTTRTLYPVADQFPDLPGLAQFYGTAAASACRETSWSVRGAKVVLSPSRLVDATGWVLFISLYCGTQFRRLQVKACNELDLEYDRGEQTIIRMMRHLRRLLGKSWADVFAELPNPVTLRLLLEWSWSNCGLELVLPLFLSSVGCGSLRRILKNADDVVLKDVAMLLADARTPLRFRRIAYQAASQRRLSPEVVEHLAYWAQHRPSEWD